MDKLIPDFTKLNWQLNVAIMAAIFSVFSLIYNDHYIAYGFVTFFYGVLGNMLTPPIEDLHPDKKLRNYLVLSSVLTVFWLLACLVVYYQGI